MVEPGNQTVLEFLPVIREKIALDEDKENDEDSDDSDDDTDAEDDEGIDDGACAVYRWPTALLLSRHGQH